MADADGEWLMAQQRGSVRGEPLFLLLAISP